jgi:hypothetical protein
MQQEIIFEQMTLEIVDGYLVVPEFEKNLVEAGAQ